MKNFAILGKWHVHATDYAGQLNALPGCRISKVWDEDEGTVKAWAEHLGCEAASVDDILNDPSIEGVIICNATNEHGEMLIRACESGKAVFTEKVLTLTSSEADAVYEAVKANNTRFAISFPHFSETGTQFAINAARSGKLGTLNYARVRKAHNGSLGDWLPPHFYDPVACGGGAMIDLGAHPMYLLCALLGEPVSVKSTFTQISGRGVEDNAVSLLEFENGAIGVSETGFMSVNYPFTIELGGTEGALLMRNQKVSWCCAETGGKWVDADDLPEEAPSPLAQWAFAEKPEDISPDFGIEVAVRLTRVMEAAYKQYK
ncbi:MAG: Gfo/Idh/MocA family oxidoreductase [Clostridia bacterium]|nr:Gfo/Idh/MocA family oxidoreductase [Clostridia bacterium]